MALHGQCLAWAKGVVIGGCDAPIEHSQHPRSLIDRLFSRRACLGCVPDVQDVPPDVLQRRLVFRRRNKRAVAAWFNHAAQLSDVTLRIEARDLRLFGVTGTASYGTRVTGNDGLAG
jgi:hypothetical protein